MSTYNTRIKNGLSVLPWLFFLTLLLAASVFAGETHVEGSSNIIVVGTELDYPPYSFINEQGRPAGFNVDLSHAIAKVMGLNIEIEIKPWGHIREGLDTGNIDVISGMFYSPQRDKQVDFSPAYTIIHHAIFIRKDSHKITSEGELSGKEIIVMRGDIMHDYALQTGLGEKGKLIVVDTQAEALRLLASGEGDCVLAAKLPGLYWVKELQLKNIVTVGPPLCPSKYSYAVKEGDAELLSLFNEGLAIIKNTGQYKQIYDHWLGALDQTGIPKRTIIKYAVFILSPLFMLFTAFTIWTYTLKRQVRCRTAKLEGEITERKQTEEKLQASRDQYSSLINNIPGITYRCKLDKDWTMLYMSSAVDQISGYPASDFIKNAVRTYESVIHREDAEYVDQKINGAVESGAPWEIEYRVCHKNGSIRWAYEKGRCVVGKDGKVEFLDGFILDITARKQAEEALRENLQRLEFALQGGELGMWDWNPEDDAVVYNNSWAQILEYRPDELEPTVDFFKQHIHPEDMAAVFDRLTGHVEGRLPVYESEHRLRTKSGRWLWVLDRGKIVERDKDGCPVRVTGIIADITDRKLSEEALRESEERFMKVLYASDDAILLIGDNTFIDCNEATASMLGYDSQEQFLQTHPSELSPETQPDGRSSCEKANEMMQTAFDRGFHRFEWIHLRANGEEFPVEVSLTPIVHEGRSMLYCVWRDITERNQAENRQAEYLAELEEAKEAALSMMEDAERAKKETEEVNMCLELATARANDMATRAEAANVAKSQFLANMSHEIRTPMNAIIGFSDILADADLTGEQREYLNIIRESGRNLLDLINDILDFSKIEAKQLEIEMVECSLGRILSTIESMMKLTAEKKSLDFKIVDCDGLPERIRTDPARLRQCLINLMNNAVKFTEKGHVYVNVSLEHRDNQPYIRFDVEDTGIGIPIDKQDAIFEAFTQADGSTSRKYDGTGLGLTVTKQLTGLLGGELTVTSEVGRGSVFSFAIPAGLDVTKQPCLDIHAVHIDPRRAETELSEFSGHVLVAEDVKTNQMLIESLLGRMGLKVTIAPDGNEALQKALAQKFDLILMDIQMPHMTGYEATKALRKAGMTTPIVALTANAMKGDDKKCIEAGCDEYLAKPIDRRELLRKIAKYLPSSTEVVSKTVDSARLQVNELTELCSDQAASKAKSDESGGADTSSNIINWHQLIDRFGDEDTIEQILPTYLKDNKEHFEKLSEAVKSGDSKAIASHAHAIKGAGRNLGVKRLSDIAGQLEFAGRDNHIEAFTPLLDKLEVEFEKAMTFLSRTDWIEIAKHQANNQVKQKC